MAAKNRQFVSCTPHFHRLKSDVSLSALSSIISEKHLPAILGANSSVQEWSLFAAEPVEVFEFSLHENCPFEKLSCFLSKYTLSDQPREKSNKGLFCGGWIGYFGYELGRYIEKLPNRSVDDLHFPLIRLAFYDKAILYDHRCSEFTLMALDLDTDEMTVERKFAVLSDWLSQSEKSISVLHAVSDFQDVNLDGVECNMTQQQYLESIAQIQQYIFDGDTYQINFSQRFETDFEGHSLDLFQWQNAHNPSPFAAYLAWGDRAVISTSPELFLKVQGDRIVTKPIKGTRSRNPLLSDQLPENLANFQDLVLSEKDQAELAMIVDLERNDLARICVPGTRTVSCTRQIETFATVYHAVATVQGQLALPAGPQRVIDILQATFPGGSITGAPKIRSMEIIDELEPTARGVYTGSIGWISLDFDLCWNIAIRTILISGQKAYVQTGGGLVADSDPKAEWEETLTKARALLMGLSVVQKT
jgi:para-aminobenzoate synthetase component 1